MGTETNRQSQRQPAQSVPASSDPPHGTREFELEIFQTTRSTVRVTSETAAEIRRRINDPSDSFAADQFNRGQKGESNYCVADIRASSRKTCLRAVPSND